MFTISSFYWGCSWCLLGYCWSFDWCSYYLNEEIFHQFFTFHHYRSFLIFVSRLFTTIFFIPFLTTVFIIVKKHCQSIDQIGFVVLFHTVWYKSSKRQPPLLSADQQLYKSVTHDLRWSVLAKLDIQSQISWIKEVEWKITLKRSIEGSITLIRSVRTSFVT